MSDILLSEAAHHYNTKCLSLGELCDMYSKGGFVFSVTDVQTAIGWWCLGVRTCSCEFMHASVRLRACAHTYRYVNAMCTLNER